MNWNDYDMAVNRTWIESGSDSVDRCRVVLGLCGESGEVAEILKKELRGDGITESEQYLKELGDVLYYVSKCAQLHGFSLERVAHANVQKLASRHARGTINGSGNER